jgi:hypothetical protein
MGLGAINIAGFIKIGSGIQKLIEEIHRYTAWRAHNPAFIFEIRKIG